ncbi:sphingolipid c9-methyltransferase [Malassezia pachydermatis]|uniref:sphingolipid C(9)-methyltransferase n=1 Tax=Malassezia pachydermatis TaxID=77020 RepID=A0A0M9VPI3_9BASI|nr:sphingolipid c9-methyltransferase [Malassezia pachydermatis]KOS14282.1 sphingolipid c9-methyltransferase [Malassezia pachydermatis]
MATSSTPVESWSVKDGAQVSSGTLAPLKSQGAAAGLAAESHATPVEEPAKLADKAPAPTAVATAAASSAPSGPDMAPTNNVLPTSDALQSEKRAEEPTARPLSTMASEPTGMNLSSSSASASASAPAANMAPGGKVRLTNYPTIKNAVLPAEGNGSFSNVHLALLIFFAPAVLLRLIPFVKPSWFGWTSYMFLVALCGVPVAIAYWTVMSMYGPRINEKVKLPNRPIEDYLDIKDPDLRRKYNGYNKIPMQIFWDAYFDGKIEVKGEMLDVLEYRWDWAAMHFTPELFRYVLFKMLPDVLLHSSRQDEEQIRDNYDRGNDFHEWFLGPQMVYTTGIISDPNREETLEELQDNKLNLVCSKLALKPGDRVLDIGCGWGTLATFAAKNYGADVTGVTLAQNQAEFGNERLAKNGISQDQARILCMDYRDIPVNPGHYNKIVSLEMAEHVGIRHYAKFLSNVYDLLDDDGVMVFQVAGLRPRWQYWDLIWGLFMNKYIFPGADASCPLNWVIGQLERAGFEVRSCDVAGIHYSATIDRWLKNWKKNEAKVKAKYGDKLYRIWLFFLASSVIIAREGGSSLFQITVTKNLNATHRIEGVESHGNLLPRPYPGKKYVSVYK